RCGGLRARRARGAGRGRCAGGRGAGWGAAARCEGGGGGRLRCAGEGCGGAGGRGEHGREQQRRRPRVRPVRRRGGGGRCVEAVRRVQGAWHLVLRRGVPEAPLGPGRPPNCLPGASAAAGVTQVLSPRLAWSNRAQHICE
ncbi:MAG: hypothetical protein J3K34DRAFT_373351, partial [Monoraphidium minutum]